MTLREAYLPDLAKRSLIDLSAVLPSGLLVRYYIFIANNTVFGTLADRRIRLQIWRPDDIAVPRYTLVYQQLVEVDTSTTGALYVVSTLNI